FGGLAEHCFDFIFRFVAVDPGLAVAIMRPQQGDEDRAHRIDFLIRLLLGQFPGSDQARIDLFALIDLPADAVELVFDLDLGVARGLGHSQSPGNIQSSSPAASGAAPAMAAANRSGVVAKRWRGFATGSLSTVLTNSTDMPTRYEMTSGRS